MAQGEIGKEGNRTMLNHNWAGGESGFIKVISMAPMNGKKPKIRLISLYLPVWCIMYLYFH